MLKHTKKPDCSCTKCALRDAGGNKPRSKKYVDNGHTTYVRTGLVRAATGKPLLRPVFVPSEAPAPAALDTSAQLPTKASQEAFKKKLQKRARSKYVTNTVAVPLASIASPLENSYKTTLRCSGHLTETSGKLTGLYCGQRWCVICSRIRTARMIAGYLPQLEEMADKWFLTLTVPNCVAAALPATISNMVKEAANIGRVLKERRKLKYSALRKLECTYNPKRDDFHPHFHFIFSSEESARAFLAEWLRRHPDCSPDAQDIKPADNNSVMELFKYFTKIATGKKYNAKTRKVEDYAIHIGALDTMFQAMRGKRVFQPSGIIRAVSEEIEPDFALPTERDLTGSYSWTGTDWFDKEMGDFLCDYVPSPAIKEIANHIVMPEKKKVRAYDYKTKKMAGKTVVRFAELPTAGASDAQLYAEYGPRPMWNYTPPTYCTTRPAGAASRRWVPSPSLTPSIPLSVYPCTRFTPSLLNRYKHSTGVRTPLRVRNGAQSGTV